MTSLEIKCKRCGNTFQCKQGSIAEYQELCPNCNSKLLKEEVRLREKTDGFFGLYYEKVKT